MKFDEILIEALDRPITKDEALILFEESQRPENYLRLFKAASAVREKECGDLFRSTAGWETTASARSIHPASTAVGL